MHNEKQNNPGWINKLDESGCLPPEEMIDKNAAWKKLHERLSEKQNKNKKIWYWTAAACLLIAFSLPILIAKKNVKNIINDVSLQNKKTPKAVAHASLTPERTGTKVENALAIEKKEINPFIRKRTNNNLPAYHASAKQIPPETSPENAKANAPQLTLNTSVSADTVSSMIAAVAPVKKKMRVVHINELENAADGMASSATDHQPGNFSLPFGNNIQTSKQSSSVTRDYAGVFKIKISSKN
jgi:hypothetical protein